MIPDHVEDLPVATIKVLEFQSISSFLVFESGEIDIEDLPEATIKIFVVF